MSYAGLAPVRYWSAIGHRPSAIGLQGAAGAPRISAPISARSSSIARRRRSRSGDGCSTRCTRTNGATLASRSDDTTIRLWDVATARPLRAFEGHTSWVLSVAFSPDGTTLASGSRDSTIRLWDVATARCLAILLATPEGWVAFTPDGRYKLGGDIAGSFWHVIGLCRFEPGELDPYLPHLRVPDGDLLIP